ncbi:MAG: asparaginase [Acidimicrobiia bacterium]|nr:asparaginase [Acidimicrobiia bacterium]NNL68336.1 asparaginase [Acidimicrobiia bacterium]
MLARAVRSGLTESYHDGAVAVFNVDGKTLLEHGDVNRPFFLRSAIKPFQALISLEAGADLKREQTALAASSHGGQPVHVAVVRTMLSDAGVPEAALACPPDRPLSPSADRRLAAGGDRAPARVLHNCSGKHAAALVACRAAGWPIESYADPTHPYQQRVRELVADLTGEPVEPVGVDGCGFPTLRGTTAGLARAFLHLAIDERFRPIREAMMAMPALTSDVDRAEAALMRWLPAAVKGGAVACMGLALDGRLGMAAKCWDGSNPALYVGVIEALDRLGVLEPVTRQGLADHARVPVYGGGQVVGAYEPALD